LRRLYSTFAGSWPGIGLLMMRGVVGAVLVVGTGLKLWHEPSLRIALSSASLAAAGLLLVVGLWTPLAGVVIAVIEISQILRVDEHPVVGLLTGTIAAGLAMLGPGRWSVDARLFGWRRIEAPLRKK
jgi:putative oxidoreductase